MAVKIRLSRGGHNNYDVYRISVADSRKASTGKFLQQIGHYDPNHNPPTLSVDEKSAVEWLLKGAELSDTVKSLFIKKGIMEKLKQVKEGKNLEDISVPEKAWKEPKKKLSKKAKAKEDAKASEEAPKEEPKPAEAEAAPAEEKVEAKAAEEKKEEPKAEAKEEKKEEPKAEAAEEKKEEKKEEEAKSEEPVKE